MHQDGIGHQMVEKTAESQVESRWNIGHQELNMITNLKVGTNGILIYGGSWNNQWDFFGGKKPSLEH